MRQQGRFLYPALVVIGLALIGWGFASPMWWVSLKAPNYPEATFPSGVRIHLHFTGVENGCVLQQNPEIHEEEPLDCVEEMNTINHYIGMHPIERGAQLEFALAPYLIGACGVLLLISVFYSGPLWWALAVPAILIPIGFMVDFTAWLWWFGHQLHPWAAFTVKPFMPTVLGQGKVAQFSTFSYPHYGMALMLASSILLTAGVLRRRQLIDQAAHPE